MLEDVGIEYRFLSQKQFSFWEGLFYAAGSEAAAWHLNESQRAMVAARIANMPHGGDRKSDQGTNSDFDRSADRTAKMLSVGRGQVARVCWSHPPSKGQESYNSIHAQCAGSAGN